MKHDMISRTPPAFSVFRPSNTLSLPRKTTRMNPSTTEAVKNDFRGWSGGFPPDSDMEIFVYLEYAFSNVIADKDEVREMLREWMCNNDDDICPYP